MPLHKPAMPFYGISGRRAGKISRGDGATDIAAFNGRKPDKPKVVSPFLKRKEAIQLLKTRSTLEACERAGWLTASTRRKRLVLYPREQVMACVYRLSQGEYPAGDIKRKKSTEANSTAQNGSTVQRFW